MEDRTRDKLRQDLDSMIEQINSSGALYKADSDELFDHLYSEIEQLKEQGLNHEEALQICKMRFGNIDLIKHEYIKERPFSVWKKRIIIGLGFFFSLSIVKSLISLISSYLLILTEPQISKNLMPFVNGGMQLVGGGVLIFLIYLTYKKRPIRINALLWLLPLISLTLYFVDTFVKTILTNMISISEYGTTILFTNYVQFAFLIALTLFGVFIMFKNRKEKDILVPE